MKVVITGAAGQLGRVLLRSVPQQVSCIAPDRRTLDITNTESARRWVANHRPDVLINAAAYTAVDKAETDRDQAFAVNDHAVRALADACRDCNARLLHVSTDFVFDGAQGRPYRPDDTVHPLSVYGESKLAGERAVLDTSGLRSLIIRTAWVYASEGRNFVLTMLRLFRERSQVNVVADQIGTPTSATSLARCLWAAVGKDDVSGILHFTDAGAASWYDFAVAIYEEAASLGLLDKEVDIIPITTDQYPTPARRPSYSVLDSQATLQQLNLKSVHWRVALREVLREIRG